MPQPSLLLQQVYSSQQFRQQAHGLVDMLADYLEKCQNSEAMPVLPWKNPEQQLATWQAQGGTPISFEELSSQLLSTAIHTHHPHFVGHQVVPPAPDAVLADFISSFINNGMAIYEMGPAATAIERLLMQWLGKKFGFEQADGVMVSGGSLGNLTALLAARQVASGHKAWQEGNPHSPRLGVMVSEEAHYCVSRAAQVMGLGEDGVIKVPANKHLQMDTSQLEKCYQEATANGIKVFAIVGSACTTSTGSYDDLEAIATFCQSKKLWFHIDGAHGAAAVFSPKHQHLVKGIEQADSVVIDFHKMMLSPALTTGVVFRKAADSYAPFAQKAAYLLDEHEQHWYDIASRTVECTKKGMSFKPYMLLRLYGEQVFTDYVSYLYELASAFAKSVRQSADFELFMEPMCNIVCFRYIPAEGRADLNEVNAHIRQALIERGNYYCVHTVIKGQRYLRVALMNPLTNTTHLEGLLDEVREVASILVLSELQ